MPLSAIKYLPYISRDLRILDSGLASVVHLRLLHRGHELVPLSYVITSVVHGRLVVAQPAIGEFADVTRVASGELLHGRRGICLELGPEAFAHSREDDIELGGELVQHSN